MKFAHLSDFHFSEKTHGFALRRPDPITVARRTIGDLRKIETQLDFITITGDLSESGDINSYRSIKNFLSVLTVPVFVVPGNHDLREPFGEVFNPDRQIGLNGKLDYKTSIGSVQLLGLDTVIEGEVTGNLDRAQLSDVEQCLLTEGFTHTVVSMHHPPFKIGHLEFDNMASVAGSEVIGELVLKAKSSVIILCGHVHRPYQAVWNGANCYIAGSPAFQMGSDFCFGESVLDAVNEPFSYLIHSIDQTGHHTVGTRYVDLGFDCDDNRAQIGGSS